MDKKENVDDKWQKELAERDEVEKGYAEAMKRRAEALQESGDIPSDFVYSYKGQTWLLVLPQSVMAQKRLIAARDKYFMTDDFAAEEAFLRLIAPNVKVDGRPINIDTLDLGALEIMKTAYMDSLLLPLFRGGAKEVTEYMRQATANVA